MGCNVQTLGVKPNGSLWTVGIQDPANPATHLGVITVGETAVVTSAAYQDQFTAMNGRTYGHILNPATGYPANNSLTSVTIICEDGTMADCLSTAMYVDEAVPAVLLILPAQLLHQRRAVQDLVDRQPVDPQLTCDLPRLDAVMRTDGGADLAFGLPHRAEASTGRSTMAVLGGRPSSSAGPVWPSIKAERGSCPMRSKPP